MLLTHRKYSVYFIKTGVWPSNNWPLNLGIDYPWIWSAPLPGASPRKGWNTRQSSVYTTKKTEIMQFFEPLKCSVSVEPLQLNNNMWHCWNRTTLPRSSCFQFNKHFTIIFFLCFCINKLNYLFIRIFIYIFVYYMYGSIIYNLKSQFGRFFD